MLTVSPTMKIFVYLPPMDMRKGFDALGGVVRAQLQSDPTDGHLYLFINKRRDRLKILHFDGGGYWLYYRLLEAGTFEELAGADPTGALAIDATELAMLLAGVSLASSSRRRKRFLPRTDARGKSAQPSPDQPPCRGIASSPEVLMLDRHGRARRQDVTATPRVARATVSTGSETCGQGRRTGLETSRAPNSAG
jgi:hypothetical protein